MNDPIHVRRGTSEDAATIAGFQRAMADETEDKALHADVVEAGVHGLLARPEAGFYVVAERAGEVAGSLMVTPEWSDWRNGWFWWVQSVYVAPAHRRAGIYRALYTHVRKEAAATSDVCGLRLYVERENDGAREVYLRLGMEETSYRLYEETF